MLGVKTSIPQLIPSCVQMCHFELGTRGHGNMGTWGHGGAKVTSRNATWYEEALHLVNDTIYGLSAAVFAGSQPEAIALASMINAGAISINDAALTAVMHEGEKNAFKFSGTGGSGIFD